MEFEATGQAEVLWLPEPAQTPPVGLLDTFPVNVRHGRMRGVETILAETYWADPVENPER